MAITFTIATLSNGGEPCAAAQSVSIPTHGDETLAALIDDAIAGSPRLQAAMLETSAAELRIRYAGTLPNPSLSFTQNLRGPETRIGPHVSSASISQTIPWFGTLANRRAIAMISFHTTRESYHEMRADIVYQVKLAYYDLAHFDEALRITEEERQLLRHYEELARARYSQGYGQQQEVIKLQTEISRVLNRRHELLRQRTDTEAFLNWLAGREADMPVLTAAIGQLPAANIEEDRLLAIGRDKRPEVRVARLQMRRHEHEILQAQKRFWPDFTLGIAWGSVLGRRDLPGSMYPPQYNGRDMFSVTLGTSIPIFRGSYDAGVQESAERLSAAEASYRQEVNTLALAIRSHTFRLTAIKEQLALYQRALLPQAEQALRTTEEAYSGGVTGVLELLDSEELLLDVRLGLARLQADYMQTLAELERTIGSAFPEEAE